MMNVLYLQRYYSKNHDPLKSVQLFEAFNRDADVCRLGYKVIDYDDITDMEFPDDFITRSQMKELQPDLIFIEGGMFDLSGSPRMEATQIEHYASAGAVVIVADVEWNALHQHREAYRAIENLFGVTFGWDWSGEPAELFDDRWCVGGNRQILVQPKDIIYDNKFASIYKDLEPFVVGLPVPLRSWSQLIATCNKSPTKGWYNLGGHNFPEPVSSAFASAKQIGSGFVVLIAGDVSADVWVDVCPSNLTWLKRIAENLIEQVRIERRRGKQTHQIFISHRHSMAQIGSRFRDELQRRGFGTWLDVRKLILGDKLTPEIIDAIKASSHFAVLWSKDCLDAPWIEFEMSKAQELGKRVFVVRFDNTAPPLGFEDHLRIEAQALTPEEIGRLVSLNIEREERNLKLGD